MGDLNNKYQGGYDVSAAVFLLGARLHFFPEFGRGGSRKIPRSWRALKGWKRLAPPRARWTRGWPLVAAVAVGLASLGRLDMAAWVIVGPGGYLRPSENVGLRQ